MKLFSSSSEFTEELGRRLGAALASTAPFSVVGLCGPLGCGKTCFTRGIAAALGVAPEQVTSPSFVYLVEYPEAHPLLVHADLYRLAGLSENARVEAFESIGLYAALDSQALSVVEWWDAFTGDTPRSLVRVEFAVEKLNDRWITLSFSGPDCAAASAAFESASA